MLCKITMKSSSFFPIFISYLAREQNKMNTITVAAVARLLPRAFLQHWKPFPQENKGFGHNFCSPELLYRRCGMSLLVVSNSPNVITESMLRTTHATFTTSMSLQGQTFSSVYTSVKRVLHGYAEPQCSQKALESLTRHVQRSFCSGVGLSKHRWVHPRLAREKSKMPSYWSALPGNWNQGHPLSPFFHFSSSGSQKDHVQSGVSGTILHALPIRPTCTLGEEVQSPFQT